MCNLGEVTLRGKRKLQQISFSSFFPRQYDSGYCDVRSKSPITMVKKVEKMKRAGSVKLIITGVLSMKVTIESFEWGENDGTGDISYTLSMKEYRTPQSYRTRLLLLSLSPWKSALWYPEV